MQTEAAQDTRATAISDLAALATMLAEQVGMKREALRNLHQAVQVAQDALQPLADNKPVSGPAQRALVTIALMSLGQAWEAITELEVVASGAIQIFEEP